MTIHVYIADDHAVVRDGLHALLEANADIQVVGGCGNGTQAVQEILALQPEVAILDISMPGVSGIDAARQILAASQQTRIIILSMLGTPEHVYRSLQAGVHGYLLKESAGREVLQAVVSVAGGETYYSQAIQKTIITDYLKQHQQAGLENPLKALSKREHEILALVLEGRTSTEIATQLYLSPKTVESYRSRMMKKLDVDDMAGLIRFAMQHGLIS